MASPCEEGRTSEAADELPRQGDLEPLLAAYVASQAEMDRRDAEADAPLVPSSEPPAPPPTVPDDGSIQAMGSSTTPAPRGDPEPERESIPPPSGPREIVMGLRAIGAAPVAPPEKRKRAPVPVVPSKKARVGVAAIGPSPLGVRRPEAISQRRAKIVTLIDGMLDDWGLEATNLKERLTESQDRLRELEEKAEATEAARSLELSQLRTQVAGLRMDLGEVTSKKLKEKAARKAKSSELRRLKKSVDRKVAAAAEESRITVRSDVESRLSRVAGSLDALMAIYDRDLARAFIDGAMNETAVLLLRDPSSRETEEARLLAERAKLEAVEGEFGSVLAALRAECVLPPLPDPSAAPMPGGGEVCEVADGGEVGTTSEPGDVGGEDAALPENDE